MLHILHIYIHITYLYIYIYIYICLLLPERLCTKVLIKKTIEDLYLVAKKSEICIFCVI